MDGQYRAPRLLQWFEERVDTGPQNWKQYTVALLIFNTVLFVFGFVVLCAAAADAAESARARHAGADDDLQHGHVVHDEHQPAALFRRPAPLELQPDLLHHLPNMFLSAAVGFCALAAIIRALRGDAHVGNFFVDMWRVVIYIFLPVALVVGVIFMQQGMPMTLPRPRSLRRSSPGRWARRQRPGQAADDRRRPGRGRHSDQALGTNGGGFFGANSAHPFENPTATDQLPHRARDDALPVRARRDVRPDARRVCAMPSSSTAS